MISFFWPILLIVGSNVVYHICAKSVPESIHPMASLTVTYSVGAVFSAILYFCMRKEGTFLGEMGKINWVPIVFGLSIVGLEAGFLYAYQKGWQISTASIVQSAMLTVILAFVGWILYHETLTWNKLVGIAVCLIGLIFINAK